MEVAPAKAEKAQKAEKSKRNEYIDPKGYWIDPNRNIRRLGNEDGEQAIVVRQPRTARTPNGTGSMKPSLSVSIRRKRKRNSELETALYRGDD
jgi:hypothetical protein